MISAGYSKDAVEIGMTFRAGCMDLVQATRLAGSFSQAIKAVTTEPDSRIHTTNDRSTRHYTRIHGLRGLGERPLTVGVRDLLRISRSSVQRLPRSPDAEIGAVRVGLGSLVAPTDRPGLLSRAPVLRAENRGRVGLRSALRPVRAREDKRLAMPARAPTCFGRGCMGDAGRGTSTSVSASASVSVASGSVPGAGLRGNEGREEEGGARERGKAGCTLCRGAAVGRRMYRARLQFMLYSDTDMKQ